MAYISKDIFKNIRRIQIHSTHTVEGLLAGAYRSAFKGRGMEFEEVREYQPEDDERAIDWNVTARMNFPYVKNFREERELTVMLVVDISASSRFGSCRLLKSELIAEIGAVLAFSAIKNNDKVGLILFSDQVEKYIPPSKGVRHVLRVIRELLVFQPKRLKTDIGVALQFLAKIQKKRGICFLLSDFISRDYTIPITLTAKRYDLITLAIIDPLEIQFPSMGLITLEDVETNDMITFDSSNKTLLNTFSEASQKRLDTHKQLMNRIGAGYIQIKTNEPYIGPLRAYLKQRQKKR